MSAPKFITPLKQTPQTSQRVLAALLLVAIALAVVAGSALAANLVKNGSFENDSNGDGIPNSWAGFLLAPGDKRVCNQSAAGDCSFKFIGEEESKDLSQTIPVSGSAGDDFKFTVWTKGKELEGGGFTNIIVQLNYSGDFDT